LYFEDKTLSSR